MSSRFSRLREGLLNNRGLKVTALILAGISWYTIRGIIGFHMDVRGVPVEVHLPEGSAILTQSVESVNVRFRGAQKDIAFLNHQRVKAVIDIPAHDGVRGPVEVKIGAEHIQGATGVRPVAIDPGTVRVTFDREVEKRLAVKADVTGRPARGEVTTVSCQPMFVTIHGPRERLLLVDGALLTESVDLSRRVTSFAAQARVLAPSAAWGARIEPAEVTVTVTIDEQESAVEFPDVPVAVVHPRRGRFGVSVVPEKVTVVATGSPDDMSRLIGADLRAFVDCSELETSATYELPLRIYSPPGVPVRLKALPPTVDVTLSE